MEIERAVGLAFCRPRTVAHRETQMDGTKIALCVLPFLLVILAFGDAATRAGERGDVEAALRFARFSMGSLGLGVVALWGWTCLEARRHRRPPPPPMTGRAIVSASNGNSAATGIVSLEGGALVFRGDTFDFRLPRRTIPVHYRAKDFTGLSARGIRLPLPRGAGSAVLRLTLPKEDRAELEEILANLTDEREPILPPIYRAVSASPMRGGWWITLLFSLAMAALALFQRTPRHLALIPAGFVLGWIYGPGLSWAETRSQTMGERAFRRLQARDAATP
ncbi:hypothetical protein EON77_04965 [bacterium]|nr:MAG: hypothetical protein EON77_04965 [bacterium]